MKKFGFTLAEVMVALALIGVVTSLTIPTFVSSNKNRTHSAKIATTISSVENAFSSMIPAEAVQTLAETEFGRDGGQTPNNLNRYLKLSGSSDNMTDYYTTANPFRTISNGNEIGNLDINRIFEMKNGALLLYENNIFPQNSPIIDSLARIFIDINGRTAPNIYGRDVFLFRLGNDGLLYPAGGQDFANWEGEGAARYDIGDGNPYACIDGNKALGCTARLIENNYEVDY